MVFLYAIRSDLWIKGEPFTDRFNLQNEPRRVLRPLPNNVDGPTRVSAVPRDADAAFFRRNKKKSGVSKFYPEFAPSVDSSSPGVNPRSKMVLTDSNSDKKFKKFSKFLRPGFKKLDSKRNVGASAQPDIGLNGKRRGQGFTDCVTKGTDNHHAKSVAAPPTSW